MTIESVVQYSRHLSDSNIVNKFGRNPDIDGGAEDIWDGGGDWVAPTEARIHAIVSSSTSDDLVGVGAQQVKVWGLTSWSADEVSETVDMDGTTPANTTNSYVIIHRMSVVANGGTSVNVGTITATAATDGTVTAQINAGYGQTQMAVYGVPSTKWLYLDNYYAGILRNTSALCDMELRVNSHPDTELVGYTLKHSMSANTAGSTNVIMPLPGFRVVGPAIVKLRASTSTTNCDVIGGFNGVLL